MRLILAKPGHEGCGIFPVSTLEEVVEYFQGRRKLENALKAGIKFDSHIAKAIDFGVIRGQKRRRRQRASPRRAATTCFSLDHPARGNRFWQAQIRGSCHDSRTPRRWS